MDRDTLLIASLRGLVATEEGKKAFNELRRAVDDSGVVSDLRTVEIIGIMQRLNEGEFCVMDRSGRLTDEAVEAILAVDADLFVDILFAADAETQE